MSGRYDGLRVVEEARLWLGTPYRHQSCLQNTGCDCLGLVRGIWRAVVGPEPEPVPPYRPDWMVSAADDPLLNVAIRHFVRASDIQPGALLVFRWHRRHAASHLAIAVDEGSMIHAHEGACVAHVPFTPAWRRRLAGVFLFPLAQMGDR